MKVRSRLSLMNYVVAVMPDRTQVEAAGSALAKADFPTSNLAIFGQGYQNPEEFGRISPNWRARRDITRLFIWLIPLGLALGYLFVLFSGIEFFPEASRIINSIIGGLIGAALGVLVSFLVGSSAELWAGSGDAAAYINRLNAGQYLITVKCPKDLAPQAIDVLRRFKTEDIQIYTENQ